MNTHRLSALLSIVLSAKLRLLFMGRENIPVNIGRLGLLVLLLLNGIGMGVMYDEFAITGPDGDLRPQMPVMLQFYGLLLIVAADYFPTVKQKNSLIPSFYPVPLWQITLVNHLADMIRPLYAYVAVVLVTMILNSELLTAVHLLLIVLWMYAAMLLNNTLKTILYNRIGSTLMAIGLPVALILYTTGYFWLGLSVDGIPQWVQLLLSLVVIAIAMTAVRMINDRVISPIYTQDLPVSNPNWSPGFNRLLISLYTRRKASVISLAVVLITKVLLFGIVYAMSLYTNRFEIELLKLIYLYLLSSPLSIYTYIYNNLAGFFKETWLTLDLYNGSPGILFRFYTLMLAPILVLDLILTVSGLLVSGFFEWKYLAFYALSTVILHAFGMFGSLYHPRYVQHMFSVDKIMGLKNNTSGMVIFYNILTLTLGIAAFEAGYVELYLLFTVLLCLGLLALVFRYPEKKYTLYQVLFQKPE